MSLPLIDLNDDGPAPAEMPDTEAPAQPAAEEAAPAEEATTEAEKTPEAPEQMGDRLRRMSAALTLRCALGGILALVLLHFGLACGAVPAWRRCPRWPLVPPCCRPLWPC